MPVRIADTIESMNPSFPAMMGSSLNININGVEKSLQNAINDGDLSGSGSSIQTDVIPIPSSEYEDKIVQYIGESGTYKNGYFYKCQAVEGSSPTQYEWVEQEVQESKDSTPHWSGTRAEYDEVKDTLEVGTYVSITDDYENEVIQWNVMPDANSDYLGKIVQYIGETNDNYVNGYFYECQIVEGSDPYVYEWKAKEVQKSTALKSVFYSDVIEDVREYEVGEVFCYTSDNDGKFKKGHFYKKEIVDKSVYMYHGDGYYYFESDKFNKGEYVYFENDVSHQNYLFYVITSSDNNNDVYVIQIKNIYSSETKTLEISSVVKTNILAEDWIDINGSSQTEVMPIASADNVGKIVQYVGETGTYKKGYFYECICNYYGLFNPKYSWKEVDHVRFNHVVYHQTTEPINSDFIAGDIIYYTGVLTDKFKPNHYYRALPSIGTMEKYKFTMNKNGGIIFWSYTPFEFKLGFVVYPSGSGGEDKPYEITSIADEKITITPYGDWGGQPLEFDGVAYASEVKDWEELEGGGGTSIFYGTMDEWNALTTDEKKQYDYMSDNDAGGNYIDTYSTSEVKTNKVWIDGKPIYRITKEGTGSFSNINWTTIMLFNDNVQKKVVNMDVTCDGACLRLEHIDITNNIMLSTVSGAGNGSSVTNAKYILTVFYTKTTD